MATITGYSTEQSASKSNAALGFGFAKGNASNSPVTVTGCRSGDTVKLALGIPTTDLSALVDFTAKTTVTAANTITSTKTGTAHLMFYVWECNP